MSDAMQFLLVSHWRIEAPRERVWQALKTPAEWPRWWRYVARVDEVDAGDAQGLGSRWRLHWTSRLPYAIRLLTRVVAIDAPSLIRADATGDLQGTGTWKLSESGDATDVEYIWAVALDKPWMRRLAPLLRPVFAWNHNAVMAAGETGLRRHLGTQ